MEKEDVIFNLRIANKKLDEELRLYRNGTTEDNILELIHEKDAEIEELRKLSNEHVDKLRRIAKSSGELITKNDSLQRENVRLTKVSEMANCKLSDTEKKMDDLEKQEAEKKLISSQREATSLEKELVIVQDKFRRSKHANEVLAEDYEAKLAKLQEEVDTLSKENENLNNSIDLLIPEAEQFQELIEALEDDACTRDTSIERLQKRCAQLIQDSKTITGLKKEMETSKINNSKEISHKNEQIAKYHAELEKAQAFNGELKDRISKEKKRIDLLEEKSTTGKGLKAAASLNVKTNVSAAIASKAKSATNSSKKLTFSGIENK